MLKIRRSRDRLIFNMLIPILARRRLYIETAPELKSRLTAKSYKTSQIYTIENHLRSIMPTKVQYGLQSKAPFFVTSIGYQFHRSFTLYAHVDF